MLKNKEIKTLIIRFRQDRMFEEAEILKELNGENALAELMSKKK